MGYSLFFIMHGQQMNNPLDNEIILLPSTGVKSADEYIEKKMPKLEVIRDCAGECQKTSGGAKVTVRQDS